MDHMPDTHTIDEFAAIVQAQQQDRLRRDYPESDQWKRQITQVKPGKIYTKVDVGPEHNMSGRYMVENATGVIFGIKGYGKVHKGHRYGTLDTLDEFDWSGYYPVQVAQ